MEMDRLALRSTLVRASLVGTSPFAKTLGLGNSSVNANQATSSMATLVLRLKPVRRTRVIKWQRAVERVLGRFIALVVLAILALALKDNVKRSILVRLILAIQ